MIELETIYVTFNPGTPLETRALNGVDLTIPDGQFVTVIGSNGAGKSTLLNTISGDIIPDRGKVKIAEQTVTKLPTHKRAKFVARVFQNPLAGSCAHLTVEENLALAYRRGKSRGLRSALNRRLREDLRAQLATLGLGLENRLRDRMGLLSGGQRQAVSLLMSTLAPNKILLLDEHTAALDPKTAESVLQLTRQIVEQRQLTTLMITHSMRQALDFGDRVLMLHQGKIIFDLAGTERNGLEVKDLLQLFEEKQDNFLSDDSLLLG
ncbi:ABC transporter ATP-binding protein [Lusitaniella coriacea LEGE 07157]|uniref:ABC transporter ATP-binding protein n=1 Tax=Lusitaniella coriacea LEGE 07157 TaxID=945747 RepID=A0A8J7B7K8_9CYAN|nr:ABC transporter ATP-binding protein [Lusitaniella coriacea]MBE9114430.1 ABC transporter ATP-binding protein [Lusitaniella coriacea LEGE 07157]